jgi:hypothetical protein
VRPADFLAALPDGLRGRDAGLGFQLPHRPRAGTRSPRWRGTEMAVDTRPQELLTLLTLLGR